MSRRRRFAAVVLAAAALVGLLAGGVAVVAQDRPIAEGELRPGSAFASDEIRNLQADDFANPGMLWVTRGEALWRTAPAGGQACAGCHGDAATSMRGVATRYPRIDAKTHELLDLPARINQCRADRQGQPPWQSESAEILSITGFIAHQSRNQAMNVDITGAAAPHFEAGRRLYNRRMGQMNLACANCHDANWGRTLYNERISQGHPTGFPAYRMEWQGVGSLERRLRACLSGIRAEMYPYGATELRQLSLYLAWRAQGLPIEAPGVRR
jgi:sulfur-oxidizing protein SoxA